MLLNSIHNTLLKRTKLQFWSGLYYEVNQRRELLIPTNDLEAGKIIRTSITVNTFVSTLLPLD
jgi:hypothetical protein